MMPKGHEIEFFNPPNHRELKEFPDVFPLEFQG